MGCILAPDYLREFSMDDGRNTDRVNEFMAWRTVRALEGIEQVLYSFYILALCVWIWYCASGLLEILWPKDKGK